MFLAQSGEFGENPYFKKSSLTKDNAEPSLYHGKKIQEGVETNS